MNIIDRKTRTLRIFILFFKEKKLIRRKHGLCGWVDPFRAFDYLLRKPVDTRCILLFLFIDHKFIQECMGNYREK